MADKFLIHGATFCGNGTTSAAAASNGAAGAWNDINVFEGTAPAYGSLNAGDTVYIRSKTAAGADITRTLAANITFGSSNADAANWINWVLDGGTKWPGINGTLTYESPSTYRTTLTNYNYYRTEVERKFILKEMNAAADAKNLLWFASSRCCVENWLIDASAAVGSPEGSLLYIQPSSEVICRNVGFKAGKRNSYEFFAQAEMSRLTLINPSIELVTLITNRGLFQAAPYGATINIYGGRIFGAGATTGAYLITPVSNGGAMTIIGTDIPKAMSIVGGSLPTSGTGKVQAMGLDNMAGAYLVEPWGSYDSRSDGYYPTLDAYIPMTTRLYWSFRLYPYGASVIEQMVVPVAKLYTDSAGTKTITGRVLVADTITTANKESLWLEINYIDNATGLPTSCTTRDFSAAALATDTAAWSATTYGAINLLKRKLEVTTPTAVKPDTPITVLLCGKVKSASALDIMFFDPAVSVS